MKLGQARMKRFFDEDKFWHLVHMWAGGAIDKTVIDFIDASIKSAVREALLKLPYTVDSDMQDKIGELLKEYE